jgi:hypothetical protein
MKLVMLGHDEGGEFHRAAYLEDVKEFLYMLGMVAVPLEPTEAMIKVVDHASRMGGIWTPASVYKAMIAEQGESDE